MGTIDFDKIYTIKGKAGLWEFKSKAGNQFIAMVKFGTKDIYATVKPELCSAINSYVIHTNEGPVRPDKVIDWLFEDSSKVEGFAYDFDSLSSEEQIKLMEHYVPNYDPSRFKPSHMSKIYKWFNELNATLSTQNAT